MRDVKPRRGPPTREMRLEALLADLQAEIEAQGGDEVKRMRRQVLRGLRLATWVFSERTPVNEIKREFHDELFRANPPIQ